MMGACSIFKCGGPNIGARQVWALKFIWFTAAFMLSPERQIDMQPIKLSVCATHIFQNACISNTGSTPAFIMKQQTLQLPQTRQLHLISKQYQNVKSVKLYFSLAIKLENQRWWTFIFANFRLFCPRTRFNYSAKTAIYFPKAGVSEYSLLSSHLKSF